MQLRHLGRGDGVGDQDFAGDAQQLGLVVVQGGVHPADDVVDVLDAAAEVGVVHALEHRGQAVALQAQGIVGAVAAGADQLVQAVQQLRVIQQQGVQVEEFADFTGERAMEALAHGVHFRAHQVDSGMQARQFSVDILRGDAFLGDFQGMRLSNPRTAKGVALGGALPGEGLPHLVDPAGAPVRPAQSCDMVRQRARA